MTQDLQRLVVVGHGAAGLAAALAAAEQARSRGLRIDVTLLEKSREAEAGGNTRWSPAYMRLDAPDRLAPGFEDDMRQSSGGLAVPGYYLSAGPARIQPVGGGSAIVEKLVGAAQRAGVKVLYETAVNALVMAEGHRVCAVEMQSSHDVTTALKADAVILAAGGFQGNAAMMRTYF